MFTVSHTQTVDHGDRHESVAIFYNGILKQAADTHPNFSRIVEGYQEGMDPDDLIELFDVEATVRDAFAKLSDRVTVEHGEVLMDGKPCEPVISRQILRLLDEGAPVEPLVKFMERLDANPSQHSRAQAFAWFNNHDFPIDDDGGVIAYKGVAGNATDGYVSCASGQAWVNGVEHNGQIPNAVGDIVTMPRSEVADNPAASCSVGLHVGTYAYAQSYARGAMLEVKVDPADVVSVPHDAAGEKIRVCKYEVLDIVTFENTNAYSGTEVAEQPVRAQPGDYVVDEDGDYGTIEESDDGVLIIRYDDRDLGLFTLYGDEGVYNSEDSFIRRAEASF